MKKFDVIVVGAGTGGCLAAKTVAEAGLSVCMIDRKPELKIGDKVCGDAIGKHHFDNIGIVHPIGDELDQTMEGIKVYSPDMETVVNVKGEGVHGYLINRLLFGQRLLKEAKDAGATLMDSTIVTEPIIKDGYIVGVSTKDSKTEEKSEIFAQVVVDASGHSAVLRKKLPPQMDIETEVNDEDVEICYREIREVKETIDEPEFCKIYLDLQRFPGGYCWIFPKSSNTVNVGLGVAMKKGFPNPKNLYNEQVLSMPLFKGSRALTGGGGLVPTRRPISSMVGNGIIIIGDAACQVNPIHGGGIGPSMMGGAKAAEVIIEALEKGDVSRESLWPYTGMFMAEYGAKQAGLDIFRILLQRLSNKEMNYGMRHHLITDDDLLKASMGEDLKLNITEKTSRLFKGLGSLSLIKKLNATAKLMREIKALYRNYPSSPEGLRKWEAETQALVDKAKNL
ncbi:MAG TPA: NAD(P)/FAD-dependent oxidoreductase [Candidatus Bathyarchaeota archaeon]|nr:NAD(P)/FAD-dependent oxidoreductase [Candidatus Bathyarchaeota archaeon]